MPHDPLSHGGPGRLDPADAKRITGPVTALSVGVALTLSLAKLAAFWMSGSVAVLASLADSALDLAASLIAFFAVRYAAEPADPEHRFGHGKAEAFAGVIQALLVAMSAALLLREGAVRLINPQPLENEAWAIGVMLFSMVMTGALIWAQGRAVRETGSVAVAGDRMHYLSDFASNAAVLIGVGAVWLAGWERADGLVAAGVALWLAWSAWKVARGALSQLLDAELPDEERARIIAIAGEDPQILGVHQLRTRAAGPLIHIQFHADLAPDLSLADAHAIIVDAEERLLKVWPAADILIHPDPHGAAEPHGAAFFQAAEADEKEAHADPGESA